MGKNLTYPDRLVNNLLQGKLGWKRVRRRHAAFAIQCLALAGSSDVATQLGVPKHDADFGQTFSKWGWRPGFYLMLPVFGPSDERDAIFGLVGDTAANPQTYFFPYDFIRFRGYCQ